MVETVTEVFTGVAAHGPLPYLIVLAMAAIDVLFPIIPSEAVVLLAAVLAGSGHLEVALVALAAALGAFIGDNVAHGIGRSMGRPLTERILKGRMDRLEWIESQIGRHGPSLIITGRFLPGGRSLVAIGSGVLKMRWLKYALFDALAVTIWSLQVVIPGYIGGSAFSERPWIGFVTGALISLGVVATIEAIRWLLRQRRGEALPRGMEDRVGHFLDKARGRLGHGAVADEEEGGEHVH